MPVVDDQPALRRLIRYALGKRGFLVFTAGDFAGAAKIPAREGDQINLAITDMGD